MLTIKCQGCGAVYKLSEDLYSKKAAGFGVVVTCRRCKTEIHVEAPADSGAAQAKPETPSETASDPQEDAATLPPARPEAPPREPAPAAEPAAAAPAAQAAPAAEPAPTAPAVAEKAAPVPAAARAPGPKASPSPPRVSAKATAPWPEAPTPSPPAAAALVPVGGAPRARPAPPAGPKFTGKRDPVSGPFVALSPGLLGVHRPEPAPDSEAPVDSSDFLEESRKPAPKAPPPRRAEPAKPPPAKSEQKTPPVKRAEPLPLKLKEPPKPPPRAPVRSDDVSDDLLSADVGFDGAPPIAPEPPRLLAPDSSALAAPPAEPEAEQESPKRRETPTPSTSDARERSSKDKKSSRAIPIVLVSLGAVGAFALAFRSQMPGADAPPAAEPRAPEPAAAAPEPAAAAPAPTPETAPAPATETNPAPTTVPAAETKPANPGAATDTRPAADPSPKPIAEAAPPGAASAKPGVTAAAPGAAPPTEPASTKAEGPFDPDAARAALATAVSQASACRKPGDPSGVASVTITFSPSGRVTNATIAGPPFAGTPTGGCIAATLRRARVPPFTGDMVTVRKTVEIQ